MPDAPRLIAILGSVTPPVGILTYISCSIGGITISQAIRARSETSRPKNQNSSPK